MTISRNNYGYMCITLISFTTDSKKYIKVISSGLNVKDKSFLDITE